MITDKQMTILGFKRVKTFKKREIGISSFCWLNNGMILTMEKDLSSDFGYDCFLPTLRIGTAIWYFTELKDLENLLKELEIK